MFQSASLNCGKSWIIKFNFSLKAKSYIFDHVLGVTSHLQWLEILGCSYFQLCQKDALGFLLYMCVNEIRSPALYICVLVSRWVYWEQDPKTCWIQLLCVCWPQRSLYWILQQHPPLCKCTKGNPINKYYFPLLLPFSCTTHNIGSIGNLKISRMESDGS